MMLKEYYKKNVDVHIDWLLYLNSFSKLKNTNYFNLTPIIEQTRKKAYEEVEQFENETNTLYINNQVKLIISSLLLEDNLKGLSSYVGYGLLDNKAVNYSIALLLSKIPNILGTDSTYLKCIKKTELSDHYDIDCLDTKAMYTYLESLRIKESDDSINEYINLVLANLQLMNIKDKDMVDRIVRLEYELETKQVIEDIDDVIKAILNVKKERDINIRKYKR